MGYTIELPGGKIPLKTEAELPGEAPVAGAPAPTEQVFGGYKIELPSDKPIAGLEPAERPAEKPAEPGIGKDLLRHGIRTAANVAESVLGIPGNLASLGYSAIRMGTKALTGKELPAQDESVLPILPFTSEGWRKYVIGPLAEKLGGKGILDPKNRTEEGISETIGDISSIMAMGGGGSQALKMAGLGNMAKYAAKEIELPGYAQEGIKLGTMLGVNLAGPGKLKNIAKNLYQDAEAALPEGADVSAGKFRAALGEIEDLVEKGKLPAAWRKTITSYDNNIVGNKALVRDVWDLDRDINNLFFGQKPPSAFKRAFPKIKTQLKDTMKIYGKENPAFFTNYTDANNLYSVLNKSNVVSKALQRWTTPGKLSAYGAIALLGGHSPMALLKTGALAKGVSGGAHVLSTFFKSPAARKYYFKTVASALKQNPKTASHFAKKLDAEFTKDL